MGSVETNTVASKLEHTRQKDRAATKETTKRVLIETILLTGHTSSVVIAGTMSPQAKMLATALLLCIFRLDTVTALSLRSINPLTRSKTTSSSSSRLFGLADSLLDTISASLPFGGTQKDEVLSKEGYVPLPPPPFQPTPEGVIQRAKLLLACDLGVQDESLLDPNFIWIGPNLASKVLGKTDYLAAGKFFDLRQVLVDY